MEGGVGDLLHVHQGLRLLVPHDGPGLLVGGAFPAGSSLLAATAAATVLLARLGGMPGRVMLRVHSVGGHHCGGTRICENSLHSRYTVLSFRPRTKTK